MSELTHGWGMDIVFELLAPGGRVIFIGIPDKSIPYDISTAQVKEARIEKAHVYPRALAPMGSGQLDVRPLITHNFTFDDSVAAFDFAL